MTKTHDREIISALLQCANFLNEYGAMEWANQLRQYAYELEAGVGVRRRRDIKRSVGEIVGVRYNSFAEHVLEDPAEDQKLVATLSTLQEFSRIKWFG